MKEKIFYVINLDNKRILILSAFLIGLFFSFFFLGVSVGKKREGISDEGSLTLNETKNLKIQDSIPFADPGRISSEGNNASAEIPEANVNSPSNTNSQESVAFKNIPPATEVVEFKKPEAVSTHVEKENIETPKEPNDSKKTKRNEEKKSKQVFSKVASSGGFSLQIAAFREKEKADELKKSISGKEKNTKAIVKKSRNGYYTVRFGSASSKKEAENLTKLLPVKLRSGVIVVKD
ncbi:SPOR domain-containing protein [Leptospira santarosai]|uniref:SPOR domain-containing protein n=1 Tax=Leptospira santarosai TaxID=28183 RepID=UPI0002BA187D|nr:SPOR domain-containing protein [Leptospira santarosai]AVV50195.1 Sporulation and cell division repeat protein [Leptospira santarosai]AVV80654.1 Sporulation and cell division repeat protein [Leptospira santarosai]EMF91385.1 sporulation and cell division repeat protein [Leptospira santarosai str. ST188]MDI7166133.1 SPOR domain-containing protein [Leptospira santarosai]MDO6393959.1 SPOR domain-containing protein [Leptospira santarosai]